MSDYATFAKSFRRQHKGQPGRFSQLISYLIAQPGYHARVKDVKQYLQVHNRQRFWQIVKRCGGWVAVEKLNPTCAESISLTPQAIEFINKVVDFEETT